MPSQFLQGIFAPVTEEVTVFNLPVTGRIPTALTGRFLRNGPNPLGVEDPETYHWFMGEGMVHGIRLRDGKAEWYRNRWVRNQSVAEALGEQWPAGPVHETFDMAPNTHVIGHAGRTLALVEAGTLPYELSYELDTVGPCDFGGTLKGGYTAHTKKDPRTGELHAIAYFFGWEFLRYTVIDPAGAVVTTVDIPVSDGPMVHDLALTQRYVVIYDLPITFSVELLKNNNAIPYGWNEEHQARVGLLPRGGEAGDVMWFDVEPCWVFHTLNAYDDGDKVVVDLAKFPSFMRDGRLEDNPNPVLDRWTIDPASGKVLQETRDERAQEFPRVDERVVSLPHRYGYTVRTDTTFFDEKAGTSLIKHDYATGRSEERWHAREAGIAEAVFVPETPDAAEDDGYLMAYAYNAERGATDLMILSARDFSGEPVALVHLPVRVPAGFHGSWVPDE